MYCNTTIVSDTPQMLTQFRQQAWWKAILVLVMRRRGFCIRGRISRETATVQDAGMLLAVPYKLLEQNRCHLVKQSDAFVLAKGQLRHNTFMSKLPTHDVGMVRQAAGEHTVRSAFE